MLLCVLFFCVVQCALHCVLNVKQFNAMATQFLALISTHSIYCLAILLYIIVESILIQPQKWRRKKCAKIKSSKLKLHSRQTYLPNSNLIEQIKAMSVHICVFVCVPFDNVSHFPWIQFVQLSSDIMMSYRISIFMVFPFCHLTCLSVHSIERNIVVMIASLYSIQHKILINCLSLIWMRLNRC